MSPHVLPPPPGRSPLVAWASSRIPTVQVSGSTIHDTTSHGLYCYPSGRDAYEAASGTSLIGGVSFYNNGTDVYDGSRHP